MIYTVFTLSSPDDELDVRYLGVTTQTVRKRTIDMFTVANKQQSSKGKSYSGNNSLVSQWIRSVFDEGKEPIISVILDTQDQAEAAACRVSTFNSLAKSGRLLNSFSGKHMGKVLRQNFDHSDTVLGRQPDRKTLCAKYSYNRKAVALGLQDKIIKRSELPDVPVFESTYE